MSNAKEFENNQMKMNKLKNSKVVMSFILASILLTGCNKLADSEESTQDSTTESQENSSGDVQGLSENDEQTIRPVQAIQVGAQDSSKVHQFNGIVKSGKESKLSFRVSGNLNKLLIKTGNFVRAGQVIARLDATDYHLNTTKTVASLDNTLANKGAVQSRINQAAAEKARAQSAYARAERLYETNSIPAAEFEQARASWLSATANVENAQLQLSAAKAQVNSAKLQVQSSKNQLNYTVLKAPFSGYVSQRLVDENEQIVAGQPIVMLSNNQQTEVEVGLPASIISNVSIGDVVGVSFFDTPNQIFPGKVVEVAFGTANSSVYPVIIRLQKGMKGILPGMAADVRFLNQEQTVDKLTIPTTAVGEDKDGKFVYVLQRQQGAKKNQPYTVIRQNVELGNMSHVGFDVVKGLTAGQIIAKSGLNMLQNGDLVTVYQK